MSKPGIYWNGEPASAETLSEVDRLATEYATDGEISTQRACSLVFGLGSVVLGSKMTPREDICDIRALSDDCTVVTLDIADDVHETIFDLEFYPKANDGNKFKMYFDRSDVLQAAGIALEAAESPFFQIELQGSENLLFLLEAIRSDELEAFIANKILKDRFEVFATSIRDALRGNRDLEFIEQRRSDAMDTGNLLVVRNDITFIRGGEVDVEVPDKIEIECEIDGTVILYSKTQEGGVFSTFVDPNNPEINEPSIEDFELRKELGEYVPTETNMQLILAAFRRTIN